jgi:hypothetical protein
VGTARIQEDDEKVEVSDQQLPTSAECFVSFKSQERILSSGRSCVYGKLEFDVWHSSVRLSIFKWATPCIGRRRGLCMTLQGVLGKG